MDTHDAKVMGDGAAVAVGLSNFMQWLPPYISFSSSVVILIYMIIRLWETDTVQKLVKKDAKHE
jgi:hypothetical protein